MGTNPGTVDGGVGCAVVDVAVSLDGAVGVAEVTGGDEVAASGTSESTPLERTPGSPEHAASTTANTTHVPRTPTDEP